MKHGMRIKWILKSVFVYKNPWWYFQLRMGKPVTVRFWAGGKLLVRDYADAIVTNEIFLGGIYDESFKGAKTLIDIGGNIGTSVLRAKQLGVKEITVYEPQKDNFYLLKKNVGSFAKCIKAGVSDKPGKMKLYYGMNHGTHSLYHGKGEYELVKIITLKKPVCDVLKLDCEGAELPIIKAMDLSKVKKVVAEYYPHEEMIAVMEKNMSVVRKGNIFYGEVTK